MSGSDPELDAPKEALDLIAKGITDTLGELKELGMVGEASVGRGFSDVSLTGMQLGHAGLTADFSSFCDRWEWGVRSLVQEGNSFAQKVGLSAGALHEQDQYLQGSFKVLTNSAMGNPYASEDEVTGKSWGDVLSDNAYTQVRDADYSAESFQKSNETIEQAWKDTAWDVSTATGSPVMQGVDAVGLRDEVNDQMHDTFGPSPEERAQQAEAQQQTQQPAQQQTQSGADTRAGNG